jgi:uncharacterized protein YndB with AHSA1/START domain
MTTSVSSANQDAVETKVYIAAPPERVFRALTDPRQLVQWWGQSGMYRVTKMEADVRVGGKWRSDGESSDGQQFYVEGEYREVDLPRLVSYTWRSSYRPGPETLVRVELVPEGKGTWVRVHHSGFSGDPEGAKSHGNGWIRVLGWMQAYVERNETIDARPAEAAQP